MSSDVSTVTGPGTAYRWARLSAQAVPAWAELVNLLAEVDETEEFYAAEDLAEELGMTGLTPELDTWAVWDAERMVGFGQVRVAEELDGDGRVRIHLEGGVHPEHRGRGLGRRLLIEMEQRGAQLAGQRHPGAPAYWRAGGGVEGASVRALLEHRGYALVRHFNLMRLDLPGTIDVPQVEGVRLVSPDEDLELAVLDAHRAAFADHWGTPPASPGTWHDHWVARSARGAVSTVALDDDDQVVCYVLCAQWVDRELAITLVGTVPPWRGRGLARACLARTVGLAQESGDYDVVELEVDSESLTGATRLYEDVGFGLKKVFAVYQRDVSGG